MRTITVIEGTNGKFEYYQYNDDLKLIHSVDDDMFQAKSIIDSLGSKKKTNEWLSNKDTKELIKGFSALSGNSRSINLFDEKQVQGDNLRYLKGIYIHRLLINYFAFWVSKKYAYKIAILLDNKFEMDRLRKENSDKDKENKSLRELVEQLHEDNNKLHEDNVKQSEQIENLLKENKKQTRMIYNQSNDITDLKDILKGNEGRLTGKEVAGSKVLMLYIESSYEGFDKNIKETYYVPLRISRVQPKYMKQPAKQIYDDKKYLFISYLPEAISQNKSILEYITNETDIGDYINPVNKGGITKIEFDMFSYITNLYGNNYKNISSKRIQRKINEYIKYFVNVYKKELHKAITNKIIDLKQPIDIDEEDKSINELKEDE